MKRVFALQLLACLAIWSADANTITRGPQAFPGGTGNFINPLLFVRFDTSLGTLTAVEISMTAAGYGTLKVINAGDTALHFINGFASVPVNVVGPGGVTISTTLSANFTGPTQADPGRTYYNGPSGNYSASGFVPGANWGFYSGLGAGTFTLNALVAGGTFGGTQVEGGESSLSFGGRETVNGTVTVTYTVPDGGLTAMLLGMGMLGLGLVRRMAK